MTWTNLFHNYYVIALDSFRKWKALEEIEIHQHRSKNDLTVLNASVPDGDLVELIDKNNNNDG